MSDVIPVVLSSDGMRHEAMSPDAQFSPAQIPVSLDKKNLLEKDESGLLLTAENLVSTLEHNPIISNVDNKLFWRTKLILRPEEKVLRSADNLLYTELGMELDAGTGVLTLYGADKTPLSQVELPLTSGVPTVTEILKDTQPPKPEGFTENPYKTGTYLHMRFRALNGKETDIWVDLTKLVDVYTAGKGISVQNNVVSVVLAKNSGLKFDSCCEDEACTCPAGLAMDVLVAGAQLAESTEFITAAGTALAEDPMFTDAVGEVLVDNTAFVEGMNNKISPTPEFVEKLVAPGDAVLTVVDGQLCTGLNLIVDTEANTIQLIGSDNSVIATVKLPDTGEALGLPTVAEFVDNPPLRPEGKYLHLRFSLASGETRDLYLNVSDLVDVYTAGEGIDITGNVVSVVHDTTLWYVNGKLGASASALVSAEDKVLSVASNKIFSELTLKFSKGAVSLRGKGGETIGSAVIPETVGIPQSAEFLMDYVAPGGSGERGAYLRLNYLTPAGEDKSFYLPLTALRYKAGNGVKVEDNVLSLNLPPTEAAGGLEFSSTGALKLKLEDLVSKMPDNELAISEVDNKLYVKRDFTADTSGDSSVTVDPDTGELKINLGALLEPGTGLVAKEGRIAIDLPTLADLLLPYLHSKIQAGVSTDTSNALKAGTDGKPYFPSDWGSL